MSISSFLNADLASEQGPGRSLVQVLTDEEKKKIGGMEILIWQQVSDSWP